MKSSIERQNKILEYIQTYSDENGFPPSVREIGAKFGIKSTSTVQYYLNKLKEQNYICCAPKRKRAIAVSGKNAACNVPLVGKVSCGNGIDAFEEIEGKFPLPQDFFPQENLFMLRASGDSMVNVGIFDGDFVVVQRMPEVSTGDIAVVMWDDVASVKRIASLRPNLVLHPENDDMSDFEILPEQNPQILGKVVGCIKRFS